MDINNQNIQNNIGEAEEDRMSELPDSHLHYILSFLDIKHVARTCVLSKRWKHIWTSIPTLDLKLRRPPELSEINKFMDFVDRTLLLHDESNIRNFKVILYNDMNASRVHSWIENLTRHNVQELSLHLYMDFDQGGIPLSIPISLFNSESLTKLKLTASPSMRFPKKSSFRSSRALHLGISNEQPFSNCLVLEELFLHYCTWFGMRNFCILTPLLKVLEIDNEFDEEKTGLEDCDLKIHAPSLVSLSYQGCVAKDYEMSSSLSLDKAVVRFVFFDPEARGPEQRMSQAVSKFLQALSHVRFLSLRVENDEVLSVANGFLSNPPKYRNLTTLALYQGATTDKLIFALLRATPNLRKLVFVELGSWSSDDEKEHDETEDLFRHLQSVGFLEFCGKERELRWVKLILKNAKSLQTMTIAFSYLFSNEKKKELVKSELPSLPRASARCVVRFV